MLFGKKAWQCYISEDEGQEMLQAHSGETCPQHLFDDVLLHLPSPIRAELVALQKTFLDDYEQAKQSGKSAAWQHQKKEQIAKSLVEKIKSKLRTVEFMSTAKCLIHNRECYLNPRQQYPELAWIDCAGWCSNRECLCNALV